MLKLAIHKPKSLLYTSGANWVYQPDPSLKQILRRRLKSHYEKFILGHFDKLNLPLYLFLSEAGTGKSRNANKFHKTAITCLSAQEDGELLTRIKEAWVFLVSYENGFTLRSDESYPYLAIGTHPLDVVSLIAKHHNKDLKNVTVILVVNGMQQLMENKNDDLAFSGTFVIPICISTITGPIDGDSLVPVFKNDEVTNTLVEDCGVHGRALEVLNDCLDGRKIEECNADTLMNDLHYNLTEKYRDAIFSSVEDARYKHIPKTDKTPDEFVRGGLIRFEQIENRVPILQDWEFADYGKQRALLNPVTSLQAKSWQSFENFVMSFHCIKSAVIEEASSYGDPFLTLDQPNTESPNKIHQFKLQKKAVSQENFQKEREKSALENDFFILFTTANCNIDIPKQSGIVDGKAFTNYFGLFAGRAYKSAMTNPSIYNIVKNIHTISPGQLCSMNQMSKE
ncbi:6259_t:CDS:2 [Funneliformis geosporum]|nr:6259_t:CDS:2 [Funneliformis geosporum]